MKGIGCNWITVYRQREIVVAYSTLLAIMVLCAVIFTPVFKKYLQFTKFMLFTLQMVDVVFFLSLGIVMNHVFSEFFIDNIVDVFRLDSELDAELGQIRVLMLKKVVAFFMSFFYLFYYFLSLMQSFDLYSMICNPFQYADLVQKHVIWKYLGWGSILCLVLASDDLWVVFAALYWFRNSRTYLLQFKTYDKISGNIDKFTIGKIIVIKVVYAIAIVRMAWKTKKALEESAKMAGSKAKVNLHRRLFYFSLLPFCLNVVSSIPEAITELTQHTGTGVDFDCLTHSWYQRVEVKEIMLGTVLPIACISYIVAYLVIFQQLRAFFLCKGDGRA